MQPLNTWSLSLQSALTGRRSAADQKVAKILERRDSLRNKRVLRLGSWFAVLSYFSYCIFDYFLFPDIARDLIATRLIVGLSFLAVLETALFLRFKIDVLQAISAGGIVAGSIYWFLTARTTDHLMHLAIFSFYASIFVLGVNLFFRFKFAISLIASLIITAFYVKSTLAFDFIDPWARNAIAFYFVNCLVLSITLSWRMKTARYQSFVDQREFKRRERRAVEISRKMEEIAETDSMTQLPNRRAIDRHFKKLTTDHRDASGFLAVILIDIDFFKRYNDRLGHQAGDECLKRIANCLFETGQRHGVVVGRHGGEEFIAISVLESSEKLAEISAQFCADVDKLMLPHPDRGDKTRTVTISAGAALEMVASDVSLEELTSQADHALYRAKSSGRATFRLYNESFRTDTHTNLEILKVIDSAIEKGRIEAAYQPVVDLNSGDVLGHETFMRIFDDEGKPISPLCFIPIAEHSGSILALGSWILDEACEAFASGSLGGLISVNVSVIQLRDPAFPLKVMATLNRNSMLPKSLAIEITESVDLLQDPVAKSAIQQLRNCGIQIWLDDFGTGYAGLKWLRDIEFDKLKIDRVFLHDCSNEQGRKLLADMVHLAKNRGLKVLVEGVETAEQLELLRQLNVDQAQGYYLGTPAPLDAIVAANAEKDSVTV